MVSHLFFYQLVLVALVWLCVMLHWAWPSDPAPVGPTTPEPPGPALPRCCYFLVILCLSQGEEIL